MVIFKDISLERGKKREIHLIASRALQILWPLAAYTPVKAVARSIEVQERSLYSRLG